MKVGFKDRRELVFLNEEKVIPATYALDPDEEFMWYLDNGASNHMTGNHSLFSNLDLRIGDKVRFGDRSCVEIEGRRSVLLDCKNGEQRLLTDVYYISYLKSNIVSLGQATEASCEVLMKHEHLWMYEPDGRLLMKVKRSPNRLYKINLKIGSPVCLYAKIDEMAWIWHARLGYANFDTIKLMSTKKIVEGIPHINHPTQLCEACLAGKRSRHVSRSNNL
jgi:hypothetical protein